MKIALVHDYLKEYGGAERVLMTLHRLYPRAPIYTAFALVGSTAAKEFKGAKINESFLSPLIKHKNLYSPLRFLAPLIWKSFNFKNFDLVIASSSWFITRGFRVGKKTKTICYCHTPPRFLYGFKTSVEWQRYLPVRLYALIVNHFLRFYDFKSAQEVDFFLANSNNVAGRIKKFYRRDSTVIYPPVKAKEIAKATKNLKPQDYFLIVSRLVGAKGIELAAEVASRAKIKIKIVGEPAGLRFLGGELNRLKANPYLEFLGRVTDEELYRLYGQCKAFLALAEDEDFGIAAVEAMAAGRPVIAYRGGGFLESVVEGKTGLFVDTLESGSLAKTVSNFRAEKYRPTDCVKQALKFDEAIFKKKLTEFIKNNA